MARRKKARKKVRRRKAKRKKKKFYSKQEILEFFIGMLIVFTATATVLTVIYNLLFLSFIMGILTLALALLLTFFGKVR